MTSVVAAMATASTEAVTISSLNAAINAAARRGDAREAVEEKFLREHAKHFATERDASKTSWYNLHDFSKLKFKRKSHQNRFSTQS